MKKDRGFTLLIAIIVTSMLLIVSFAISNMAFKQIVMASAQLESQYAFYNADSGLDCAIYWDLKHQGTTNPSPFDIDYPTGAIACWATNLSVITTGSQNIDLSAGNIVQSLIGGGGSGNRTSIFKVDYTHGCAIVRVTKQVDGYTNIESRGYNTCDVNSPRRYERGISILYD